MPFPTRLLNDYETVVLDLHPHWWFWGSSAITLGSTLALSAVVKAQLSGVPETILSYLLIAAILVSAGWLVVNLVKWRTTYFVVTSHRLIYRQGVVARGGVEIPLERVNNVNFNQSMFERVLQVGDLLIESGGADGQQLFSDIAQPEVVQNIIHASIRTRVGTKLNADGGTSVAAELERLEGLRDRGTLTDAEFEEQKRRLLE